MELQKQTSFEQTGHISEKDLEEIFTTQYNDLFSKLIKKSLEEFISLLKQQIILHLRIIDKQCDSSLLTHFYEKYQYISKNEKNKVLKILRDIKSYQDKNLIYLNIIDIYIHCNKCKEAIHKCGNKLIKFENLFFCIKCKRVYNSKHIKLLCKECNKTYITTERNDMEKRNNYIYSVSYLKYHCFIENEEKIKCLNCDNDLYYNINIQSNSKEKNGIRDIFCINCKLIFDTKEIFFKCKICGGNFKAEPQIYRNFPSIKKYLLLLVHTFRKNIYALPDFITNKKCSCDLNGVQYFLHKDNGRLYEGNKDGKKVIICDHCYGIFKNENFNWNCPLCGGSFKDGINNRNMRFNKNKMKKSANNTNIKIMNINNEEKNKKDQNKNLNKNKTNILYNSIAYSNEKNNFNFDSSKELERELSLTSQKRSNTLLESESEEKTNKIIVYNSDKKKISIKNDTTNQKSIKNENSNNYKLSAKYKRIKPAQLFKNYENGINNNTNVINNVNNNFSQKRENKRSMSYINKNYNINKDINNLNDNYPQTEEKNRAISSFKKSVISECKPLFNIKESICEESIDNNSSEKKKLNKFQKNIENVIPQNLFLKNKNNNCNNNSISISINNNLIQLRCSPNIKTDNKLQKNKVKTKNKIISPEMKLLNNSSSSKLIIGENNEQNIILNNNKEIFKKKKLTNFLGKAENKVKGGSTQKTNNNKINLINDKDIDQNIENINELLSSQDFNNKVKKIKKIKKVINIRDKAKIGNNKEISNSKKLLKNESKKIIRKKINNNEIINITKNIDKKEIKNIDSEQKENLEPGLSLIKIEEKNQECNQIKKINKIKIKKISDNQINKAKNIKIINSNKISNPNVFIITKNNISTNEKNNYNSLCIEDKNDKNNHYLSIITDDSNNNYVYNNIPNSTKNKNKIIVGNEENINNENYNKENKKENGHKKNNLSFHINNINNLNEIKNINPYKKEIINNNNKMKMKIVQVNNRNNNNNNQKKIKNKIKKNIKSNKNIYNKKNQCNDNTKIINSNINESNNNTINNNNNTINNNTINNNNSINNNNKTINNIINNNINNNNRSNNIYNDINNTVNTNINSNKNNNINNIIKENININKNKESNEIINLNINNNMLPIKSDLITNNEEYNKNLKDINYNALKNNIQSNNNENVNKISLNNLNNIENNHKLFELKLYFSSLEQEIDENLPRTFSFDIRNSQNHMNILKSDNYEFKTFDSNYYTILHQIGKGSYGKIYLVEDPKTKEQFALKKIIIGDSIELKENQDEYILTQKLSKLNPELKIVKKYAIEIKKLDKYNLVMYVLMEVANCDWEQELINRQKDNAFYTEIELIEILKSLVNTLSFLQKQGISHRDVKPQNILCFGKDGYKLSDFGEAKSKKKTLIKNNNFEENTTKQTIRGTELYMSPILFKALQKNSFDGVQYNAYKSDVFSLGMCFLLASCLNYQSLYEIREVYDMNILKGIVEKYLKNYSKNYANLIINMLQINEKMRPDFIELNSMII